MGEPAMRGAVIVLWTSVSLLLGLVSAQAEKRVALVVGNDRYANLPADRQLQRAVNDARAVGEALGRIGCERGLGRIEPAQGVFTLYSAGLGQTALDRLGPNDGNSNSVFTRALLPLLSKPGLDLTALAQDVREDVAKLAGSIGHAQTPA